MSSEQLDRSNEMRPDYRGLDSTDPGEAASVDPCVGGEKKGYVLRFKLIRRRQMKEAKGVSQLYVRFCKENAQGDEDSYPNDVTVPLLLSLQCFSSGDMSDTFINDYPCP